MLIYVISYSEYALIFQQYYNICYSLFFFFSSLPAIANTYQKQSNPSKKIMGYNFRSKDLWENRNTQQYRVGYGKQKITIICFTGFFLYLIQMMCNFSVRKETCVIATCERRRSNSADSVSIACLSFLHWDVSGSFFPVTHCNALKVSSREETRHKRLDTI